MSNDYRFVSLSEFAQQLLDNPGHLYNYTLNSPEEDNLPGFEPEGWFGAVVTNLFDAETPTLIAGYYGSHQWATEVENVEAVINTLSTLHLCVEGISPLVVCAEKQTRTVQSLR